MSPQRTRDWLEQARADLRAARDLLRAGHHTWCCFACQQAAEKALKAVLEHLRMPRPGHNLLDLLAHVSGQLQVPESVRRACVVLNRYYAFPSGVPAQMFDEQDAREALSHAQEVLAFAERAMGLGGH